MLDNSYNKLSLVISLVLKRSDQVITCTKSFYKISFKKVHGFHSNIDKNHLCVSHDWKCHLDIKLTDAWYAQNVKLKGMCGTACTTVLIHNVVYPQLLMEHCNWLIYTPQMLKWTIYLFMSCAIYDRNIMHRSDEVVICACTKLCEITYLNINLIDIIWDRDKHSWNQNKLKKSHYLRFYAKNLSHKQSIFVVQDIQ